MKATASSSAKPRGRPRATSQQQQQDDNNNNKTATKKKRAHNPLPTNSSNGHDDVGVGGAAGGGGGGSKRIKAAATAAVAATTSSTTTTTNTGMAPRNPQWDTRYEELKAFQIEHGHCLVPQRYPPNPPLGTWVRTQRDRKKGHKKNIGRPLSKQEIQDLNDIGFVWDLSTVAAGAPASGAAPAAPSPPTSAAAAAKVVSVATAAAALSKAAKAPSSTAAVSRKRPKPQKKQASSSSSNNKGVPWEERYEELCAFQQIYGHCSPSRKEHSQFLVLATWVATQRQRKKGRKGLSTMSQEEIDKLEAIGFEWEPAKKTKIANASLVMASDADAVDAFAADADAVERHDPTSAEEV